MSNETELKCIDCAKFVFDTETSAAIPVANGAFEGRRTCSIGGWASELDTCEIPKDFKNLGRYLETILTPAG